MSRVSSEAGGEIGWESHGGGPELVLLHGTLADRSCWEPLVPHLAGSHRLHCVDRRGRGLSATAPPRADVQAEVADLAAVVAALGGRPAVCAWSYGAVVAVEAALAGVPMSRLVAYDPPLPGVRPVVPPGLPGRYASLVDAGDPEAAITTFLVEALATPRPFIEIIKQSPAWAAAVASAAAASAEIAALDAYRYPGSRLQGCRLPTLVLAGALSPPALRSAAERLAGDLPAARLSVLENQHHFAFAVDPAGFASLVAAFLA